MSTATAHDAQQFLEAPWLDGVAEPLRWWLWEAVRPASAAKGSTLLDEGRPNDRLWFAPGGTVAVERARPGRAAESLAELAGPAVYGTTTFFRRSLPTITLRAREAIAGWILDRPAYERLRLDHPDAAEALALLVVRVLSERFDQMDRHISTLMADHASNGDHPRANEWADFRNRLFEESSA